MTARRKRLQWLLIAALAVVLGVGSTFALAATDGWRGGPRRCVTPTFSGRVVDVTLTDLGGWNGPGMMDGHHRSTHRWGTGSMRMFVEPGTIAAGEVTLRVRNSGMLGHEALVLPLPPGQVSGARGVGPDGRVDEAGSLGEASKTCGADAGDGIAAGAVSWTTLTLPPGRYELLCNLPGHYEAGAYAEFDVIDPRTA